MDVYQGLAVAAFAVAVVGAVLTVVLNRRSRRVKEPSWAIRSTNLVSGARERLPDLDIAYGGTQVDNLTISRVLFWNRGRETIYSQDVATTDPVRIAPAAEAVTLLHVGVLQVNNKASELSCVVAPQEAILRFDYLDQGQGAVLEVVHTGTSSQDLGVVGAIKGAGSPTQRTMKVVVYLPLPTSAAFDRSLKPSTRRRIAAMVTLLPGPVLCAVAGGTALGMLLAGREFRPSDGALFGPLLVYGVVITIASAMRYLSREAIPQGLEAFEEGL